MVMEVPLPMYVYYLIVFLPHCFIAFDYYLIRFFLFFLSNILTERRAAVVCPETAAQGSLHGVADSWRSQSGREPVPLSL